MYAVFVRNWWKHNPEWPNGLEPDPCARKKYIQRNIKSEDEAMRIARHYNATHLPGRYSRKAEFEEQ